MNNSKWETRVFTSDLSLERDEETGRIHGRPIVYDVPADLGVFVEYIDRDALNGANLTDVRLCLNHDTDYVYARSRRNNANSTMQLNPNEKGMDIDATLAIGKSARHMDLYTAIEREDMDKMSFMFRVADDEWIGLDTEKPVRHIKKIESVLEVSVVTFPAYQQTFVEIEADARQALENARSALERARQQKATPLESGTDIELLKARNQNIIKLLGGKS